MSDGALDENGLPVSAGASPSLEKRLAEAEAERDELQELFERQWDAQMRGVERWRAEADPPGSRNLTLPDTAEFIFWLLEGSERLDAALAREKALVKAVEAERAFHRAAVQKQMSWGEGIRVGEQVDAALAASKGALKDG